MDVRGALTDAVRAFLEAPRDWSWEPTPAIVAWNESRRITVVLGDDHLSMAFDEPTTEDVVANVQNVLDLVIRELAIVRFDGVSVYAIWLLAAETRGSAADSLQASLAAENIRTLLEPFGGRADDASFWFEFATAGKTQTSVRAMALSSEEIQESSDFASSFSENELPPAAAMVKVQRQHSADLPSSDVIPAVDRHLGQIQQNGSAFIARLLS